MRKGPILFVFEWAARHQPVNNFPNSDKAMLGRRRGEVSKRSSGETVFAGGIVTVILSAPAKPKLPGAAGCSGADSHRKKLLVFRISKKTKVATFLGGNLCLT